MEQINESAVLNGQLTRWKINYPILVLHLSALANKHESPLRTYFYRETSSQFRQMGGIHN